MTENERILRRTNLRSYALMIALGGAAIWILNGLVALAGWIW